MILLDELVVGTDPIQGAALAQAILEEFANRNAMVIVTTHYENLKILPYTDDRFRNGAMGFDPDTGHPTYRLALDAPGASSALQTARRLGLDEGIVERAGELAGPDQRALQTVIEDLERERDTLHRLRVDAQEEFNRHQVARAAFEAREKTLKERLKKGLQSERGGALDDARKLRNELVSIRKSIRRKVTAKDTEWLAAAQKQAEEVISDVTKSRADEQRELAGPELDPGTLEIGQSVWVVSLGHEAVIEELPDSKGRCHVRAGPLAVQVSAADLRSRRHGKSEKKKTSAHRGTKPTPDVQGWDDVSPQIPDNTVDLRGLRVDEALERLEKFLDDCYGRDMGSAFVIHGHGTGALKREVREWLRTSRYVREQRRGGRYEGGDGVTAVLLQS